MKAILKKAWSKLKEKDGQGMFTPVVAVMLGMIFLILLSNFIYLYSMVSGIADYTQQAILQTATSNAYNAYNGVREGNSSAHLYAGSGIWNGMVSTSEITTRLEDMLQLERKGNGLYKYQDGALKYAISDIQIHCSNVEVGAEGNSVTLTFKTTVVAEVPLYYLGALLHVKKPISLLSYYTPLF